MNRYEDLPEMMTKMTGDEKHAPSAMSTLDVLWTLYDQVLHLTPEGVDAPDRDRFLLSKGHGPMAFYAVLAAKGFIPLFECFHVLVTSNRTRSEPVSRFTEQPDH